MADLPPGVVAFGPEKTCTLDNCPIEWSNLQYRPSLPANIIFAVVFAVIGVAHAYLGLRWRSWGFMGGMLAGCLCEVIGYVGRILMYDDPFSYAGFMIQIVCLTIAPVFYTASIYVTLSKVIIHFAPDLSRFHPKLFYWIFIPFDILCLILQAAGGALSSDTSGENTDIGVDVSLAGLSLQVVVLTAFVACFGDYMVRYVRSGRFHGFGWRFVTFFVGLSVATILILARCAFRVAELRDGYGEGLITHEIPFIILEGVVIVIAAIALGFGHPGLVFGREDTPRKHSSDSEESGVATPRK